MNIREGYKQTEVGVIPEEWEVVELEEHSKISMSNVDKKSISEEAAVLLCNYMDVYNNDYITNDIEFMSATASKIQIEKFTLKVGDIMITKDSETKADIARAATVTEPLNNVLCGYHLALIEPSKEQFDSIFLTKLFDYSNVRKQLVNQANGTTRFGLNVRTIKKLKIPFPPIEEQKKIADILSTVDQKIDVIDTRIEETEMLKKGLMQKLLSEGIGHSEFKDSEVGRIPVNWEVESLENHVKIISGQSPSRFELNGERYKFFKVNQLNFCTKYLTESEFVYDESDVNNLQPGAVIFPKRGAAIFTNKVRILATEGFLDTNLMALIPKKTLNNEYLYYWLIWFELSNIADTSSIPQINNKHINPLKIPLPPIEEQQKISSILMSVDDKLELLENKKEAFENLKQGLMQKLLTGEVRVKV